LESPPTIAWGAILFSEFEAKELFNCEPIVFGRILCTTNAYNTNNVRNTDK